MIPTAKTSTHKGVRIDSSSLAGSTDICEGQFQDADAYPPEKLDGGKPVHQA